jgi:UDP-N-acetylglucosamine 2-epimerase (hydrolysing)
MRRIVFLTGTRADFGKLKPLIETCLKSGDFEVHVFATGMHMQAKYGSTVDEIRKCGYPNIFCYINHTSEETMDRTLAKTIEGLSGFVAEVMPDLIVVHGDRVEALAGAIVGALNNIRVAHVEGGEVSGTIDELIRHAVSKMSHSHFVANDEAQNRLLQMGEQENSVFVIGSPDIDIMKSETLPGLQEARARYDITFATHAILMFHPVTTEFENMGEHARAVVEAVLECGDEFIVIYPNNDRGSGSILAAYEKLRGSARFRIFPSVRFEFFLVLLKHATYIVGNSSAGVREAPYYGVPCVNIGTRQNNRVQHGEIHHCGYGKDEILRAIEAARISKPEKLRLFGDGTSAPRFLAILRDPAFWAINRQKQFRDFQSSRMFAAL